VLRLLLFSLLFLSFLQVKAQNNDILIVSDNEYYKVSQFENILKEEISKLLSSRFQSEILNADYTQLSDYKLQKFAQNSQLTITIGEKSLKSIIPFIKDKPIIAVKFPWDEFNFQLPEKCFQIDIPFDFVGDLNEFTSAFNLDKVFIVQQESDIRIKELINKKISGKGINYEFIRIDQLSLLPDSLKVGCYFLPITQFSLIEKELDILNKKRIPSMVIHDLSSLDAGITICKLPQTSKDVLAKTIAINVLKILEKKEIESADDIQSDQYSMYINMRSIRQINKYPKPEYFFNATLVNITDFPSDTLYSLENIILKTLENNPKFNISKADIKIADIERKKAYKKFLPQVNAGLSEVLLSDNLAEASMGQKGTSTLSAVASYNQILFNEKALAQITIKKIQKENAQLANNREYLDLVVDASQAYYSLLFAKTNLTIQNEHIKRVRQNLEIAIVQHAIGETSISIVNRWKSELSISQMAINEAMTMTQSAIYKLNEIMNQSLTSPFTVTEELNTNMLTFYDDIVLILQNVEKSRYFADFIIQKSNENLPEFKQIENAIKSQERLNKSYTQNAFMPTIAINAYAGDVLDRQGVTPIPNLPIPNPPDDLTWNASFSLSIPIFDSQRRSNAQLTKIQIDKLQEQEQLIHNQIELATRSTIEKLRASYFDIQLSESAMNSAKENFNIAQRAYKEGTLSAIQLLDVQEVVVKTEQKLAIAKYQFILQHIGLERLIGKYYFISDKEEFDDFIKEFNTFLIVNN
jgi:outer membrane protein